MGTRRAYYRLNEGLAREPSFDDIPSLDDSC